MTKTENTDPGSKDTQPIFRNKYFFTKVLFVFAAAMFWLLTKLAQDGYTDRVSFEIEWVTESDDKIITEVSTREVVVRIEGGGFALLRSNLNLNRKIRLVVDKTDKVADNRFEWNTRFNTEMLSRQLPDDVKILDIVPDKVSIKVDQLSSKMVTVIPVIKDELTPPYKIWGEVILEENEVELIAPKDIVDSTMKIYTEPIIIKGEEENQILTTTLNLEGLPNTRSKPAQIKAEVTVKVYTEKILEVPIIPQNVPSNGTVRLFPSFVTVRINVAQDQFESVNASDFSCIADFKEMNSSANRIGLRLENIPQYIDVIDWNDKSVEFLIIE